MNDGSDFMRSYNKFKEILKPVYVGISTSLTLLSATVCSIANAFNLSMVTPYAFIVFCISVSALLAQLLLAMSICNETLENMNIKNSGILIPSRADQVRNELTNLLNDYTEDIKKIKIICYGTSGYNNTIYHVYNKVINRIILFDVMFCSPDVVFQNSASDKEKIINIVNEVNQDDNFNFYYSKYLPTIRGCIVYNKNDEPIWDCVQTYCYTDSPAFPSAGYEHSYAIVGRKENTYLLKNNAKIIEKEFERLRAGKNPIAKTNGGSTDEST